MIKDKKFTNLEIENTSKSIREIIMHQIMNEIEEMPDKYGYDQEIIDSIEFSLYINHNDKVIWKGGKTRFVKVFELELNRMVENNELSFEDVGFLTYLASRFTNYEDNIIRINDEYASKISLISALKNVNGKSESYYKRIISRLMKQNVLLVMKNPQNKSKNIYYISPYIFYKGKYMDKEVKNALISKINQL